MRFSFFLIFPLIITISACTGREFTPVEPLQKKDKRLSCHEILLEINEAEFHRDDAAKNMKVSVGDALSPLGYIDTYQSGKGAVDAAQSRIKYLQKIYGIMKCDPEENRPIAAPITQPSANISAKNVVIPGQASVPAPQQTIIAPPANPAQVYIPSGPVYGRAAGGFVHPMYPVIQHGYGASSW